jgi:hypothetical protein
MIQAIPPSQPFEKPWLEPRPNPKMSNNAAKCPETVIFMREILGQIVDLVL